MKNKKFCSDLDEEQSTRIVENQPCFLENVYRSLSSDGVAVINVPGVTRPVDSPSSVKNGDAGKARVAQQSSIVNDLNDRGFIDTKQYDEVSCSDFLSYLTPKKNVSGFLTNPLILCSCFIYRPKQDTSVPGIMLSVSNRIFQSQTGIKMRLRLI